MGYKVTDEQLSEMKELYTQGKNRVYIATQFGIAPCTFDRWKKNNFTRISRKGKKGKKRSVIIDFDEVEKLYRQGYAYHEIAEEMGCALSTLRLRIAEKRKEDPTFLPKDDISTIVRRNYYRVKELVDQNYNTKEIMDKLNMSKTSVAYYKRQIRIDDNSDIIYKLTRQNNSLKEENKVLHETIETLKHELEVAYQIDNYNNSDIPALRRRIYDLEETFDAIKQHFNIGLAQMSSVRYTEYEKQESEDV